MAKKNAKKSRHGHRPGSKKRKAMKDRRKR